MMNRQTAFLMIMLALCAVPVAAQADQQTVADYFHNGARSFIGENLAQAASTVSDGLAKYPGDPELTELDALIREAMEQQQQNQGQGNEQEQAENEQQENEDGGERQQEGEQQEGEESESGQEEQEQEQEQEQEGEQQNEENQQGDAGDSGQPPSEIPVNSDQLTPEEAERILQALANEEAKLLREVQKVKGRPRRVEKDW